MEVYKFETTILENGMVQIPDFLKFQDKRVRIYIEPITKESKVIEEKQKTLDDFFEQWGGFAKGVEDADDVRYNYLMEKYK